MARISVVVPSLNQGPFIEATLRSLFSQGFPDLEVILVDGGSTDSTPQIIDKYLKAISIVISEPDNGQTDALNKGFHVATGEILGWLCSDDLLEANSLQFVARQFEGDVHTQWIYGDACIIDRLGKRIKMKKEPPFSPFVWFWDYNFIPQPSCFWRKNLYEAVGGLDPSFECAMDTDLFARFLRIAQPCHVSSVLSSIRIYPEQKNQRLREVSDAEDHRIRERELGRPISRTEARMKKMFAKSVRVLTRGFAGGYF